MSGLEVAGLVLGSIPLVISALEHYKEGLRSVQIWRKYAREINSLTRQLRMQHNILTNVCETLLEDLGLGSRVDAMIEAPFGPMWQDADTRQKLRRRLHRDFNLFEDTVKDMGEAIDEVKKKLDLGPDGKVRLTAVIQVPWSSQKHQKVPSTVVFTMESPSLSYV